MRTVPTISALLLVAALTGQAAAAPGDLDPTFGTLGVVTTPFTTTYAAANALIVDPSDRLVAAGDIHSNDGVNSDFVVARYDANGGLDGTFGTGGVTTTDLGGFDGAAALARQSNGFIVVAGQRIVSGNRTIGVVRYDGSGVLDPLFGTGGIVLTPTAMNDVTAAVAIYPSTGKIVVGGRSLVRYDSGGVLDPTFGTGGIVPTAVSGNIKALVVQPDGKLVAAGGASAGGTFVARFLDDGSLDPSFGTGGIVGPSGSFGSVARAVLLQSDGKIVAAGPGGISFGADFAIARYLPNGDLDPSFGIVTTNLGAADSANGVAIQSDGKLVAAGDSFSNGVPSTNRFALARYNPNGTPDGTFGTAGTVRTPIGAGSGGTSTATAAAVVIQSTGRIVLAGSSNAGSTRVFTLAGYLGGGPLVCGNGVLEAGEPCDDGNVANGDCCSSTCTVEANGSSCNADDDACTVADSCQAGSCVAGAPVVCDPEGECTLAGQCEPTLGICFYLPRADGTACDDGEPGTCSTGDQCVAGVCAPAGGGDGDADGVCDADDDCPGVANADQVDIDGDGAGDACDDADASLNVVKAKIKRTTGTSPRGSITAKGDFVTSQPGDTFDAASGVGVRVTDALGLAQTSSWAASACVTTVSGRTKCQSPDKTAKLDVRQLRATPTVYKFSLRLTKLAINAPFGPPVGVTIADGGVGVGRDRVGSTENCASTNSGLTCR
jgi:uncharacterized delta-60 repeat protein